MNCDCKFTKLLDTALLCVQHISSPLILPEGNRSVQGSILHRPKANTSSELTTSLSSVLSVLSVAPLSLPTDSVGEVAHLMQFEQKAVSDVKCAEANPDSNGPFNPVHAQAFV